MAASIALLRQLYPDPQLSDGEIVSKAAAEFGLDPVDVANEVGFAGGTGSLRGERWSSSVDSFQANLYDVGAGLARGVGLPGVADWADRQRRDNTIQADIAGGRATRQGAVNSFADIRGLGDFGNWAEGVAIGTAPQIGAMGVGALGGLAVGGPIGAAAGAAAVGFPSNMGSVLGAQRDQTRTAQNPDGSVDLLSSAALAVPYTLVDTATGVAGKLFGRGLRAGQAAEQVAQRGMLSRMGREGLKTAGEETAGEVFQTGLEEYGRTVVDPSASMFSPEAMGRYGEAAAGGALLGGVVGGVSGIPGSRRQVDLLNPQGGPAGEPPLLGYTPTWTPQVFPDGSVATTPDDELMHRYSIAPDQLANLRGTADYVGAPGVRMDPDVAVPGSPMPGAPAAPEVDPEQQAIEEAAKEFERRTRAAHQTFTDMGPDGATPTTRLKQQDVVLHHNLMELRAAGVITPEQFTTYAGAVKAALRAGDKSAVNAVRKEVAQLVKENESAGGMHVRVRETMKGAPRRAQELGSQLFKLVDEGKVSEDDIVDYVNDLTGRRPDYEAAEIFIKEAQDVESGSARAAGVAAGTAAAPGADAAGGPRSLGRMAADARGGVSVAPGTPVASGAKTAPVGDGKAGGSPAAVAPGDAAKFLTAFKGLPDRTRDIVKRWMGVDDNLQTLDEPESLESIGASLPNGKSGGTGVSRQAVHKEIRAFLKSVGMPENLTPDKVRARFLIEVDDLSDIARHTDSAAGTKATSVTAPDGKEAGNSDDAAFAGAADERDLRDEEGNAQPAPEDDAPVDDDVEGGTRPDDEVDRQVLQADSVEQLLAQDIKVGRVIPTDIEEAAAEWDDDIPEGVKPWAELEPSAQAAWVRNYAYTGGNPSAKTQESLNAQDDANKQRAPKPDPADAEGAERPAASEPAEKRAAPGNQRGGQQVQGPGAAAPAKPAVAPPPAKPAEKPVAKVGTVRRVKKGEAAAKPAATAEPEKILTPKEQWDALAAKTPGMPAWGDLTAKQQDKATDLAHRDQFNLAAAQRIAGDTVSKSAQTDAEADIATAAELRVVSEKSFFSLPGAAEALKDYATVGISHVIGWVNFITHAPAVNAKGRRVTDGWISGARDAAGRVDMLAAFRDDLPAIERRFTVAHEFAHVADLTPYGGVYSAHPDFRPGGAAWEELHALYEGGNDFWDAVLEYPMGQLTVDETAGELFAQMMAVYTDARIRHWLADTAPATYKFMELATNDIRNQKAPTLHYQQEVASRRAAFQRQVKAQGSAQLGDQAGRGRDRETGGTAGQAGQVVGVSKGYAGRLSRVSALRAQNYNVALRMAKKGKSAEVIRAATSWFKGPHDGKWRFEFDDSEARFKGDLYKLVPETELFKTPKYVKLGDVLEHKRLFKLYPAAKDIDVVVRKGLMDFGGLQGWSSGNEIGITPYAKDPLSTLLHEIQHWIQAQEGFAPGGNENSVMDALTPEQMKRAAKQVLDKLTKTQNENAETRAALQQLQFNGTELDKYNAMERDSAAQYKGFKEAEKQYGDSTQSPVTKAIKDEWMRAHNAAREAKLALWRKTFGTDDYFKLRPTERKAFQSVTSNVVPATPAEAIAKLDEDIVKTQQKIAGLQSGDPAALKAAIKESGQAHGLYRAIAGEIEARDVQARQKLTNPERTATEPFSSEKFDPADVVITGGQQVSPSVSLMKTTRGFQRWLKKIEKNAETDTAPKLVRDLRDNGLTELPKMLLRKDVRELVGKLVRDLNGPFDPDFWRKEMAGDNTFMLEAGDTKMGRITMRQAIGPRDLYDFKISDALAEELRLFDLAANSLLNKHREEIGFPDAPEQPSSEGLPMWHDKRMEDPRYAREYARFEEQLQSYNARVSAMHAEFAEKFGFDPGPFYDSSVEFRDPPPFEPLFDGDTDPNLADRDPARIAKERLWAVINSVAGAEAMGVKTGAYWDMQRGTARVAEEASRASKRRGEGPEAPAVSRSAGVNRAAAATEALAQQQSAAGRVLAAAPQPARDAFTNIRDKFKKISPWLLTNLQLAKEFGKEIASLNRYVGLGDLLRQDRTRMQMEFNAVAVDWDKLDTKVKGELNALMQAATMQEMHPDLKFDDKDNAHLKRVDKAEETKLRVKHAALAAQYRALTPAAAQVYQRAKALLEKSWKDRAEAYKALVADTYSDSMVAAQEAGDFERAEKLRRQGEAAEQDYMDRLAKIKGPYFPLMRFGEYLAIGESAEYTAAKAALEGTEGEARKKAQAKLDALTRDGDHYVVSAHENRAAAEAAQRQYAARGLAARTRLGELRLDEARPMTKDTITHLTEAVTAKVGGEQSAALRDALTEVFLRGLPEMHALRREAERKGVAGASADMLRAFSAAGQSNAFYASRLRFTKDMADTMLTMKKEVADNIDLQHVHREMQQRMALDMKFTRTPIQDAATTLSWVYHLGVSPSFLLMNATQPWLVSVPVLAGRFGLGKATSAMARASRDALAVLRDARWKDGKWDWWSGISEDSIPGPSRNEDRAAIRKLLQRGIVDEGIQHELNMFASDSSRWLSKVQRVMGWSTQQVEVANRLATALAAFRLARQNKMTEEEAVEYAYDVTHTTQLDYSSDSTARFMRTGGGIPGAKLIFQFRRYQQGMNYLLMSNIRKAFGEGPEATHARATLGYYAMASGASAGILGLPYIGTAMFLANLLIPDDDEEGDAETRLKNYLVHMTGDRDVATALAKGLPTLWGWDLSKRVGSSDLASIFPMAKYDQAKTGRDKMSETLFNVAGPAAGTAAQILDGVSTFGAGDFVKGTEKMVPKAVADVIKAGRYSTDGMTTAKGEEILGPDELSAWNIASRGLGISSTREANYYEGTRAMQSVKTAVTDRRSQIANKYRAAVSRGGDLAAVRESILEFNQDHPAHAIKPRDEVSWRKDAQKARQQRGESGVRVNPARDKGYESLMDFAR